MKKTDVEILWEMAAHGRGEYSPKRAKKVFDDVISDIVRDANGWRCSYPRCDGHYEPPTQALHHAHLFPRRHHSVRWLFCCGLSLCFGHHRWFDQVQHLRIDFILDDDYRKPQMSFLLDKGYEKKELQRLALLAKQTWDGNYHTIATQLLSYIDML